MGPVLRVHTAATASPCLLPQSGTRLVLLAAWAAACRAACPAAWPRGISGGVPDNWMLCRAKSIAHDLWFPLFSRDPVSASDRPAGCAERHGPRFSEDLALKRLRREISPARRRAGSCDDRRTPRRRPPRQCVPQSRYSFRDCSKSGSSRTIASFLFPADPRITFSKCRPVSAVGRVPTGLQDLDQDRPGELPGLMPRRVW